jgi:hypothetical protein
MVLASLGLTWVSGEFGRRDGVSGLQLGSLVDYAIPSLAAYRAVLAPVIPLLALSAALVSPVGGALRLASGTLRSIESALSASLGAIALVVALFAVTLEQRGGLVTGPGAGLLVAVLGSVLVLCGPLVARLLAGRANSRALDRAANLRERPDPHRRTIA